MKKHKNVLVFGGVDNTVSFDENNFFKQAGVFKLNTKGQLVFKAPSKKLLISGAITENYRNYTLRQINAVMKHTNPIFIDPETADIDEIRAMLNHAWSRNYIPTFYGAIEGGTDDSDRTDLRHYKTLNFGIFTGVNPDRTNTDFIFAYFSQSESEYELDDELEGFNTYTGRSIHIVDTLNDMFGICSGVDYTLFHTIKINEMPGLKAVIDRMYLDQPFKPVIKDVTPNLNLLADAISTEDE